jgi:threonine dehydratase
VTPVGLQRAREAQSLLAAHFSPTPLTRAPSLCAPGREVYLKIESGLPTGSFKVRGAVYSLSVNLARRRITEVVAASTGNHGAAVAYAGQLLKIKATIFLPVNPNPVKAARIRELGATIVKSGADLSAAIDAAYEYTDRTRAFFLHDATDPDVPVGTATIGMEIVAQLPSVDRVYVPMGDTALVRGVASAVTQMKPSASVIGVVAANAPAYFLSWQQRRAVETESAGTIADGLAVSRPLAPNVEAILSLLADVRTVSEEELLAAIRHLRAREGITAEPAAAAATAAFMKDPQPATSVLLVTGCNISPEVRSRLARHAKNNKR